MRAVRILGLLLPVTFVLAAVCAGIGAIVAAARRGTANVDAIAWAMWTCGGVVVLVPRGCSWSRSVSRSPCSDAR